jgi:flagellar protein FlaG
MEILGPGNTRLQPGDLGLQGPRKDIEASQRPEQQAATRNVSADLESTLADLEQMSAIYNRRLKFSINREIDRVIVKIIDANTDKVIKELPSGQLQRLYRRIREAISLIMDE